VGGWRNRLRRVLVPVAAAGCILAAGPACRARTTAAPSAPPPDPKVVAAAHAGFDESTGLWFPPYLSRDAYLDHWDAEHDLIRDAQRAFAADPALRKEVCSLVTHPKRPVDPSLLHPSVRQQVSMLGQLCVGLDAASRPSWGAEHEWRKNEQRYRKALEAASPLSLDERERTERFRRLDSQLSVPGDRWGQLDRAFEMLGLLPESDAAIFRILSVSPHEGSVNAPFQVVLQRILKDQSAPGMSDAARYRMAMRNYLYFTGKLGESQSETRAFLEDGAFASWKSENAAFLGLLERLAGGSSALKREATHCSPPADEAATYARRPAGAYAFDRYVDLACHDIELNGASSPPLLADVLEEVIGAEPTNWRRRSRAIACAMRLNPARGRELAEELFKTPSKNLPLDVRLDALADVEAVSRKLHDFRGAVTACDRYLEVLRYRPADLPSDIWARLTTLPEAPYPREADIERRGWLSASWALEKKALSSTEAGDFPGARRDIEAFLANALRLVEAIGSRDAAGRVAALANLDGLESKERGPVAALLEADPDVVRAEADKQARRTRGLLRGYAAALFGAGLREEAMRVGAYLIAQPGGWNYLPVKLYPIFHRARESGAPLSPASRPWDASTKLVRVAELVP
jgi:hypothetical protein